MKNERIFVVASPRLRACCLENSSVSTDLLLQIIPNEMPLTQNGY